MTRLWNLRVRIALAILPKPSFVLLPADAETTAALFDAIGDDALDEPCGPDCHCNDPDTEGTNG